MAKGSKKKVYTKYPFSDDGKEPTGDFRVVANFLPSVDQLVFKEEKEKITLELNKRSVNFFRKAAKRRRVPYQKMIRVLLDEYVNRAEH